MSIYRILYMISQCIHSRYRCKITISRIKERIIGIRKIESSCQVINIIIHILSWFIFVL